MNNHFLRFDLQDQVALVTGAARGIGPPSKGTAKIKNPFDGTSEKVPGGAAYHFAVKVRCEKAFVHDARLAFSSELVAVVEKTFGRQFYEVGALSRS